MESVALFASEECIRAAVNTIKASIAKSNRWSIPKGAGTPVNVAFVAGLDDGCEFGPRDIGSVPGNDWDAELGH